MSRKVPDLNILGLVGKAVELVHARLEHDLIDDELFRFRQHVERRRREGCLVACGIDQPLGLESPC